MSCLLRASTTGGGLEAATYSVPRSYFSLLPRRSRAHDSKECGLRRLPRHCIRAAAGVLENDKDCKDIEAAEEEEFEDFDAAEDSNSLTTQQVQTLLNVVCDETEIAEIELKMGGFSMKMRRKMTAEAPGQIPQHLYSGGGSAPGPAIEQPFQSTASMDESQFIPPPQSSNGSAASLDEEDSVDENLLFIGAPKVGIFRRGRYIKAKKVGKGPIVDVGARVKKGQILGFIEQLGTFVPIEAPQAGEIAAFVVDEGKAVEYKEVLVEISPFFGGHIIGDKKYA